MSVRKSFTIARHWAAACTLAAVAAATGTASASNGFPAGQPIKMLVPAAPGGTTDIAARLLAEPLGKVLGQTVVVENRPGASGGIATNAVARSAPNGYTLLFQYSAFHVITPQIMSNVPWDPIKDFSPVAHVTMAPQVVVVNADLPVKTLDELVKYDKRRPGELNYASSGVGSMQHVGAELLNQMAGTKFVHVPYKGTGPALTDLVSGAVGFTITTAPPLLSFVKQGRLRALAVTSDDPLGALPDVPTVAQAGYPALQASSWLAVYAPGGTPASVVEKLAKAIQEVVATQEFRQKTEDMGAQAIYMGPSELARYTQSEYDRWGEIVRTAGIRVD